MKIIQFVPYLDRSRGGPPEVVRQFSRELLQRGHKVHVCFTDSPPCASDRVIGAIYHDLIGCIDIYALISGKTRNQLVRILDGAERVLLHTAWQPLHAVVRASCVRQGIPFAYMPHGMLDRYCMRQKALRKWIYLNLLERRLLRNAHRVVMTTSSEREQSATALGRDHAPIAIVPLGVALPEGLPEPNLPPCVLFLGRLHYKKGIERLLRAWSLWRDRPSDATLRIAGRGDRAYEQKLQHLASDLGVAESVTFVGEVRGPEKWQLFANTRVFVLPSYQENFGLAVAEALCAGARVVVGEGVNIAKDVLAHGGAVVAEGDAFEERFAEALAGLWSATDGERAARAVRAKRQFTWTASVDALLLALGGGT